MIFSKQKSEFYKDTIQDAADLNTSDIKRLRREERDIFDEKSRLTQRN